MRKIITLGIMLLFIGMAISSSTGTINEKKKEYDESIFDNCQLGNDFVHMICFIESNDVQHKQLRHSALYLPYPICFGIGVFSIDLIGEDNEERIKITNLIGTKSYTVDVNVLVRGFIGRINPSGSVSGGFLKGFALITHISILL